MKTLTHTDSKGKAAMVDISDKLESLRTAEAYSEVILGKDAFEAVKSNNAAKGDVLATAKIAAIQAAKKTYELIPLCHSIFITNVDLSFSLNEKNLSLEIISHVKTSARTGVEMEALTAVSVAALTVYDMCKALDKGIRINNIHLISKTGGKSGDYFDGR